MDRREKEQSATQLFDAFPARTPRARLSYSVVAMTGEAMLFFDLVCLIVAGLLSTLICSHCWLTSLSLTPRLGGDGVLQTTLVAAVLAPFILYDKRFGSIASGGQFVTLVRSHALRFLSFAAVVWVLGALSQSLGNFPRGWLALWFVASVLLTSLLRVLVARYMRHLQRRGVLTEVIAVVGAGPIADRLVQMLRQTRPQSIDILGVFDDSISRAAPGALQRAGGTLAQLIEIGKTRKIDWILLALPPASEHRMLSMVQRLKALSVPIALCPQHIELAAPSLPIGYLANSVPVSLLADRPIQRWDAVVKGAEDLIIGGIITISLLPVLALIALAIRLDGPGPIIFKQRRHALNNREFDVYKFRTMRWSDPVIDSLRQTSRNDSRITRIGRLLRSSSLDELPQLFNVLKGEMSLVGPRPHAVDMRTEERLGHEITDMYAHRHRVKPGITGWSQVNGARGATDTTAQLQRRVELDLHYIANWSLLLDLRILALTARVVIGRTNAY
jgi:Undecaprenyl-phosphate glucose phosphotransferase